MAKRDAIIKKILELSPSIEKSELVRLSTEHLEEIITACFQKKEKELAAQTFYLNLLSHYGHKLRWVACGRDKKAPHNVAVECEDCNEVIIEADKPDEE